MKKTTFIRVKVVFLMETEEVNRLIVEVNRLVMEVNTSTSEEKLPRHHFHSS